MKCPSCSHEFRGHRFWTSYNDGRKSTYTRICPGCNVTFVEPKKIKLKKTCDRCEHWLIEVSLEWGSLHPMGSECKKLYIKGTNENFRCNLWEEKK